MESHKAMVVPLHYNWKYLNYCCNLINEEWPRSLTARMHCLTSSCDDFPTSLVLVIINENSGEELVIGHSKISLLYKIPTACFITSVVIAKEFRNKGWGRYLMSETEKYVKTKGKSGVYLSTSNKEEFYKKLGYSECKPISMYSDKSIELKNSNFKKSFESIKVCKNQSLTMAVPPLPPSCESNYMPNRNTKIYMIKFLS